MEGRKSAPTSSSFSSRPPMDYTKRLPQSYLPTLITEDEDNFDNNKDFQCCSKDLTELNIAKRRIEQLENENALLRITCYDKKNEVYAKEFEIFQMEQQVERLEHQIDLTIEEINEYREEAERARSELRNYVHEMSALKEKLLEEEETPRHILALMHSGRKRKQTQQTPSSSKRTRESSPESDDDDQSPKETNFYTVKILGMKANPYMADKRYLEWTMQRRASYIVETRQEREQRLQRERRGQARDGGT